MLVFLQWVEILDTVYDHTFKSGKLHQPHDRHGQQSQQSQPWHDDRRTVLRVSRLGRSAPLGPRRRGRRGVGRRGRPRGGRSRGLDGGGARGRGRGIGLAGLGRLVPADDEVDHLVAVALNVLAVDGAVVACVAVDVAGVAVRDDAVGELVLADADVVAVKDLWVCPLSACIAQLVCGWARRKTYAVVLGGALVVGGVGDMRWVAKEDDGDDYMSTGQI